MYQQEGRNLRVALVFELNVRLAKVVLPFRSPIECTPKQLQSISAAFRPEEHCLVIAPSLANGALPVIIGTAPRPRTDLPPPQLYHPSVVIDVEAPGVVALSIGEAKAVLKRGEIHEQSRGIPGLYLNREIDYLVNEVCFQSDHLEKLRLQGESGGIAWGDRRWDCHRSELRAIATRSATRIYHRTLRSIARKMFTSRRGGAILLLPESNDRQGLFHGGRWYQRPNLEIFRYLVQILRLETIERLAQAGRMALPEPGLNAPSEPISLANERDRSTLRSTLSSLEDACQHCADLTEADGATVLRTDFGIEGFSAKLTSFEGSLPDPLAQFLETRGNRHRSMAGTIARQPGGIGLVVSQDGEITVFTHQEEQGPRHVELVL